MQRLRLFRLFFLAAYLAALFSPAPLSAGAPDAVPESAACERGQTVLDGPALRREASAQAPCLVSEISCRGARTAGPRLDTALLSGAGAFRAPRLRRFLSGTSSSRGLSRLRRYAVSPRGPPALA